MIDEVESSRDVATEAEACLVTAVHTGRSNLVVSRGGIRAGHHRSCLSCPEWVVPACQRD